MTAFLTSPVFIVLLAIFAVLVLAFVIWLMRDGPNARSRRGGMVDLVGAKPKGMAWDWPEAPTAGSGGAGARVIVGTYWIPGEGRYEIVNGGPERLVEPDRRPSFGV